ncbi:MAG TPA: hypothetical protein DCP28_20485, partial [Cytophagales bacterium]|nr:hypothetical protein [Cytophagales bacterium]
QEITVGSRSVIDITMAEATTQLTEVVVVGYGSAREQDLSSSISKLGDEQIANVPAAYSFDGAIQGKAAGVNITTSSATPGAAINVNVRGTTSIGASSQPLYIVDGIPLVTQNNSALNNNIQPVNPLEDINPNDIESISVLKDASAAAIYGSRGANGVVLITTKRGSAGKTKVSVGYQAGISQISNVPDMMTRQEWIGFLNVAAANDGLGENYWNDILGDPNDASLPTYSAYDHIFRTGATHNADISLRGGDEKTQFFISGNYFNQDGIQVGQGFQRASARINLDHSLNDKLGVGTSILLSRTNHQRTINENDEYGVVVNAQAWDPTAPLIDESGEFTNPFDFNGWWALENPLVIANDYLNTSRTARVLASTFLTYDILDNLQFKTAWSVDFNTLNEESFIPAGRNQTDIGLGSYATFEELGWLTENTLSYTHTFADIHDVSVVAGYTVQESRSEFSSISASGYPTNELTKLALAANITGASSTATAFGLMSFFGRANYSLMGKYLLTATLRSDGSSRFGANTRFGTFP